MSKLIKKNRKKMILFIVGAGRSGSTVLDKFIGSHSEAFSMGEVSFFSKMVQQKGLCSCEKSTNDCYFYDSIIKDINASDPEFNTLFRYRDKRVILTFFNIISMFISLLSKLNLLTQKTKNTLENNSRLIHAIAEKSGKHVFVDSSKNIVRALLLDNLFLEEFECKYVYLVRNPVANAYSQTKNHIVNIEFQTRAPVKNIDTGNKRPIEKAVSFWRFHNLITLMLLQFVVNAKDCKLVKYECFIADCKKTFEGLSSLHGLTWEGTMTNLNHKEHHIIGGNLSKINAKKIENKPRNYKQYFNKNELRLIKKKTALTMRLINKM